ncbi:Kid domain containing protein, partial [Reticulomyxa filosa]
LHRLLWQHRKVWNKSKDCNDPVLKILATLGAPPGPVKFSDNHLINLQLRCLNNNNDDDDDDDNNNSNGDDYDHKSNHLDSKEDNKNNMARDYIANVRVNEDALVNQVREKIKTILVNDSVPEMLLEQCRTSLRTYLQDVKVWAKKNNKYQVIQDCEKAMQGIEKYLRLNHMDSNSNTQFNEFLLAYIYETRDMKRRVDRFHDKIKTVKKARNIVADRNKYLESKLSAYQQYLANIMDVDHHGLGSELVGTKYTSKKKVKQVKFTHQKLLQLRVIVEVDKKSLDAQRLNPNNLLYYFSRGNTSDEFQLDVKSKVSFATKTDVFAQPFVLSFTKLLEMKDKHHMRYKLDMFTFHTEYLVDLFNDHFLKNCK